PGLAVMRIEGGKVVVVEDRTEGITQGQIGMAFGKGRPGHPGGVVWHRRDDMQGERHARHPSTAWVKALHIYVSVLYHSALHRGTPWAHNPAQYIFYYRNIFCSNYTEKGSHVTLQKPGDPIVSLRHIVYFHLYTLEL